MADLLIGHRARIPQSVGDNAARRLDQYPTAAEPDCEVTALEAVREYVEEVIGVADLVGEQSVGPWARCRRYRPPAWRQRHGQPTWVPSGS